MTVERRASADTMLAQSSDPAVLAALSDLADPDSDSARFLGASRAKSTRASYACDWEVFSRWAEDAYQVTLPSADESNRVVLSEAVHPALVIRFLSDLADERKASTLTRYLAGIRHHHHANGLASPTDHPQVKQVLAGVKRELPSRTKQAKPLYLAELKAAVGQLDDSLLGLRDRALLLVGWWGALRVSEIVGLKVSDIEDHPEGVVLTLRKSKTDQTGEGREVPLHYREDPQVCPVLALRGWLRSASIDEGFIFRHARREDLDRPLCECHGAEMIRNGHHNGGTPKWACAGIGKFSGKPIDRRWVIELVRKAVSSIGLDPKPYSAHSLRAGFVSEADRRHIPTGAVRAVTGHKSDQMLNLYSRPAQLFNDSAGAFFEEV